MGSVLSEAVGSLPPTPPHSPHSYCVPGGRGDSGVEFLSQGHLQKQTRVHGLRRGKSGDAQWVSALTPSPEGAPCFFCGDSMRHLLSKFMFLWQELDLCKNGVTCLSKQHVITIAMSQKLEFRKQDLQTRSRQFKGRKYKIMKEIQPAYALSALTDIDCSISHVIRKPQHMDLKLKYKPIVSRHIQSNSTSVY